jgi:hypothetical protein
MRLPPDDHVIHALAAEHLTPKHHRLMPKCHVLGLKPALRLE